MQTLLCLAPWRTQLVGHATTPSGGLHRVFNLQEVNCTRSFRTRDLSGRAWRLGPRLMPRGACALISCFPTSVSALVCLCWCEHLPGWVLLTHVKMHPHWLPLNAQEAVRLGVKYLYVLLEDLTPHSVGQEFTRSHDGDGSALLRDVWGLTGKISRLGRLTSQGLRSPEGWCAPRSDC